MKKSLLLIALCIAAAASNAETILNLKRSDTPEQIQKRFPNTQLEELRHVTMPEDDKIFEWKGAPTSVPASVLLSYTTGRRIDEISAQRLRDQLKTANLLEQWQIKSRLAEIDLTKNQANKQQPFLYQIHYLLKESMPIDKLIQSYGKPDDTRSTGNFVTALMWSRGVVAIVSPDQSNVISITFIPSENE